MAGVTSPSGAASTQRAPGAPELRSATTSCGGPTSHSPRAGSVTERPGRRCPVRHPVDARPPQDHRRRSRRAGGARRDPHVGERSPLNPHADGRWQHERDLADKWAGLTRGSRGLDADDGVSRHLNLPARPRTRPGERPGTGRWIAKVLLTEVRRRVSDLPTARRRIRGAGGRTGVGTCGRRRGCEGASGGPPEPRG